MVKAKIYIEGGGDGSALRALFRKAWRQFFQAAGLVGRMPAVVRGGSREETWRKFSTAFVEAPSDEVPILLVDAEGPVASGHSAWRHLAKRDGWSRPSGAEDEQAFLMVQFMETWLLADAEGLAKYFGAAFRGSALRSWPDLEEVPRKTVLDALQRASAECRTRYAKGEVSFELLARTDPKSVEDKCSHARRLLDHLRGNLFAPGRRRRQGGGAGRNSPG